MLWTYAIGFFLGAASHAMDILHGGFLPYTAVPLAINIYLTSLLPMDLLVVGLISSRPRLAALLAVVIMISDVSVNLYEHLGLGIGRSNIVSDVRMLIIIIFATFVLVTAPAIWRRPLS